MGLKGQRVDGSGIPSPSDPRIRDDPLRTIFSRSKSSALLRVKGKLGRACGIAGCESASDLEAIFVKSRTGCVVGGNHRQK